MLALILAGGSGLAWLVTARWLYGRWRGSPRGERECVTHGSPLRRSLRGIRCCYDETANPDGLTAALAMAAALLWPLALLALMVRWHPPVTDMERAEALAASQARVAELEAELGMQDGAP